MKILTRRWGLAAAASVVVAGSAVAATVASAGVLRRLSAEMAEMTVWAAPGLGQVNTQAGGRGAAAAVTRNV